MSHTTASSHKKKKPLKKPAGKPSAIPTGNPVDEPPSRNKITVILSLEGTLLQLFYSGYHFFSEGGYTLDTLNYKNLNGTESSVIVLKRPNLTTFIKYILDNSKYFNIGFFTTMNEEQAYGAYNMLQKIRKFKPYIFVCYKGIDRKYPTSNDNYGKTFKTYHYYDILNKKVIDIPILKAYYNKHLDINILINHSDFKDKLHPNRTIFIHRSGNMNPVSSIKNTIPVIPWDTSMTCDDTLKKVSEWLEKHKETKSFESITLPNYVARSPFTKIKYPHNTKFYDRTASKICKNMTRIQRKKKTDVSKTKKRKH